MSYIDFEFSKQKSIIKGLNRYIVQDKNTFVIDNRNINCIVNNVMEGIMLLGRGLVV